MKFLVMWTLITTFNRKRICSLTTLTEIWKRISEVRNKKTNYVHSPSSWRLLAVYFVTLPEGPVAETLTFMDAVLGNKQKFN